MTGVGVLFCAFVHRDRWLYLWFGLGSALLYVSQAWSVDGLYPTQADFDRAAAEASGNAALVAMAGPARALNTVGGQVTWQAAAFGAIVAGLMSMLIVGRHTRGAEESGRDELLRAAPVGRFAPTLAALLDAALANVVAGALVAASLAGYGLTVADSVALGVGLTLCGWCFAGVALVACQVGATTRAAYGLTGAAIGAAYLLRAVGDVSVPALSWLSPIGWYQAMHAFSGLRWWPALLLVAGGLATAALGYAVLDRRDYGAGVLAARSGPARGSRRLASAWGLAWRLQRPSALGWLVGLTIAGLCMGAMGDDVGDVVGDSDLSRDLVLQGTQDLVDGFYATIVAMLALLACGFAISSALRPRAEEEAGRADPVLVTALPRWRWLGGHVAVTVGGAVVLLAASGLALGTAYAVVTGDEQAPLRLGAAVLAQLPGVLVLSELARLLYGAAPRLASLAWAALVVAAVVLVFGQLLDLPQWLQDVSPFEHLALVPAEDFALGPALAVTAVGLGLSVAGQVAFIRRDVH